MGGRRLGSVADDVQMRSYVPIDSSVRTPYNQRIQKRVSMLDRNIKDTRSMAVTNTVDKQAVYITWEYLYEECI